MRPPGPVSITHHTITDCSVESSGADMRRREFFGLIGGAAVAWPVVARAQQAAMPVIGYLSARSAEVDGPMLAAFRRGLFETGYVEGRDVRIEIRFADGRYNRLPTLMDDLIARHVAAITTAGGLVSATAAKRTWDRHPTSAPSAVADHRFGSDWWRA